MSDNNPILIPEDKPEAQHLEVEDYDDADRVDAPEWYDDTVNVGDVANAQTEGAET